MLLKRVFDHSTGSPVLDHVKVLRSGRRQNFTARRLEQLVTAGLATLGKGEITLDTVPPLRYRIIRAPGYYCCHCEQAMVDGLSAREHIAKEHAGAPSPDASNPAGYRRDNFFACEKA